jgi:pimeloyl-ACP methyl ester carboxylesterase
MNFQRFLAAIAVVIVASCSDLSTVLDRQEKNLAIDGVYERQFHTALYFPKGESLHYPGYLVGIEKSPRDVVGGPTTANRFAYPDADYIVADKARWPAKTTSDILKLYEDHRKALFLSHIVRYGAPLVAKKGSESSALIDQCFVYNSFESQFPGDSGSVVAWRHCGLRPGESELNHVTVQVPSVSGAANTTRDITRDQFQEAGDAAEIYSGGLKALKKLECGLVAHVNAEHYTHLVIIVMGWNTSQDEAIRNFNDIVGNMVEASQDQQFAARFAGAGEAEVAEAQFKPLVVGVTWPSYWNKSKLDFVSYFDKADDADELGLTWLNVLVNRTIPLVLAQPQKDKSGKPTSSHSLRVVLIGHSFGARVAMRALFSGPVLTPPANLKNPQPSDGPAKPSPMVDLAVGLEGAVSVNRFIPSESAEGAPYRDYASIGTKIVLTASKYDHATTLPVWYKPSGSAHVWREECGNATEVFDCWSAADTFTYASRPEKVTGNFTLCPFSGDGKCVPVSTLPAKTEKNKILYLNTSEGITRYNSPDTGGGAHSDIYRLPMGRLLYLLTETYARPYAQNDPGRQIDPSTIKDAETAAKDCASTGLTTAGTEDSPRQ